MKLSINKEGFCYYQFDDTTRFYVAKVWKYESGHWYVNPTDSNLYENNDPFSLGSFTSKSDAMEYVHSMCKNLFKQVLEKKQ